MVQFIVDIRFNLVYYNIMKDARNVKMTKEMTKEDFEKLTKMEKQELIAMYYDVLLQFEELKKRNSEMG